MVAERECNVNLLGERKFLISRILKKHVLRHAAVAVVPWRPGKKAGGTVNETKRLLALCRGTLGAFAAFFFCVTPRRVVLQEGSESDDEANDTEGGQEKGRKKGSRAVVDISDISEDDDDDDDDDEEGEGEGGESSADDSDEGDDDGSDSEISVVKVVVGGGGGGGGSKKKKKRSSSVKAAAERRKSRKDKASNRSGGGKGRRHGGGAEGIVGDAESSSAVKKLSNLSCFRSCVYFDVDDLDDDVLLTTCA